jgi:hypothetical protein
MFTEHELSKWPPLWSYTLLDRTSQCERKAHLNAAEAVGEAIAQVHLVELGPAAPIVAGGLDDGAARRDAVASVEALVLGVRLDGRTDSESGNGQSGGDVSEELHFE